MNKHGTQSVSTQDSPAAIAIRAALVRADTALRSFRDAGYGLGDAVAEAVDNAIQAGAKQVHIDWIGEDVQEGRSRKGAFEVQSLAMADDGVGIPPDLLPHVLTVGFSTRYGSRDGIGRFGVGFKLASLSQARRLEVYTMPAFLKSVEQKNADGSKTWSFAEPNIEKRVFMVYLDLDEIETGAQEFYEAKEVTGFPAEFEHLVEGADSGTMIVWRKTDRLNAKGVSYRERPDEKLRELVQFLSRTYRVYIDRGFKIFVNRSTEPLTLYDPTFTLENPFANKLGEPDSMACEPVDDGSIKIDGHEVVWRVTLTPKVTRLKEGGGGVKGPKGDLQFEKLRIPDNQGKVSFLRYGREISYTVVPWLLPGGVDKVDRYIGIEVSFPPALDEYFQVRHIKRGAEPVDKLREELRKKLDKPVRTARKRIRDFWAEVKTNEPKPPDDVSGGRDTAETVAAGAETGMPTGKGGQEVTRDQENEALIQAAKEIGITDPQQQQEFATQAKQKPVLAIDTQWPGKGLLDIEHLSTTVVVKINRKHPFIQQVYLPIREAVERQAEGLDTHQVTRILEAAADGIDLLLFAYAKAENMSKTPEADYGELREDWGKFAAVYLSRRQEVKVE